MSGWLLSARLTDCKVEGKSLRGYQRLGMGRGRKIVVIPQVLAWLNSLPSRHHIQNSCGHAVRGTIDCKTQSVARSSNFSQQHSTWLSTAWCDTETPGVKPRERYKMFKMLKISKMVKMFHQVKKNKQTNKKTSLLILHLSFPDHKFIHILTTQPRSFGSPCGARSKEHIHFIVW